MEQPKVYSLFNGESRNFAECRFQIMHFFQIAAFCDAILLTVYESLHIFCALYQLPTEGARDGRNGGMRIPPAMQRLQRWRINAIPHPG
jgi:hypothetical protein